MNKLEVGMYVRTKEWGIQKIAWFDNEEPIMECGFTVFQKSGYKTSDNIIDLIKPKDIILGSDGKLYQCWKVYKDYVFTYSKNKQGKTITLVDYQIDRVMCYEQFESMSYKVGE